MNVLKRAADYNKKRRKKAWRSKMLSVIAVFVVFCTTYSLIMPAITMESQREETTETSDVSSSETGESGGEDSSPSEDSSPDADNGSNKEESDSSSEDATEPSEDGNETTDPADSTDPADPGEDNDGETTDPENPGEATDPENPGEATDPENPGEATDPENPGEVTDPENPGETTDPENPGETTDPENPGEATDPENPGEATDPENPGEATDPENPGEATDPEVPAEPEEPVAPPPIIEENPNPDAPVLPEIPEGGGVDNKGEVLDGNGDVVLDDNNNPVVVPLPPVQPVIPTVPVQPVAPEVPVPPVVAIPLPVIPGVQLPVAAEEIQKSVDNRFYQAVFRVNYNGDLYEGDVLDFTAKTVGQDEMESSRDYKYTSLIPDSMTLPMGRTEFALTKNGNPVDRSEYTVSVEIIPSRESVAFLYMNQEAGRDTMMLENGGEEECEVEILGSKFSLYELENDELYEAEYADVDLGGKDMDAYMEKAYTEDEDGNLVPNYDEAYSFKAGVLGEDFMITAGTEYELIETLDTFGDENRYANQGYWWMNVMHNVSVWWEGFVPAGNKIDHAEANVDKVYLTHVSSTGNVDGAPTEIPKGNEGHNTQTGKGVLLTEVFPDAAPTKKPGGGVGGDDHSDSMYDDAYDYEPCEAEEATHFKVDRSLFGEKPLMVSRKNTSLWNEWLQTAKNVNSVTPGAMPITYYKQVLPSAPNEGHDFALLEIVPEPGYYVTQVVITCCLKHQYIQNGQANLWGDDTSYLGDAYHLCEVYNDGNAFRQNFSVAEGSRVSMVVDSESFCHANSWEDTTERYVAHSYYIMIQTAPIPSPLYVEYDLGNSNLAEQFKNSNDWVSASTTQTETNIQQVNGNVSWKISKSGNDNTWVNGDLVFTSGSLTQGVIDYARNLGLEFDGWELKYFSAASPNGTNIDFQKPFNEGSTTMMEAGETKELLTHARLVAKWVEVPVATITKEVTGLDENDNQERTFKFKVEGSGKEFTVKMTVRELVNGTYQDVEKVIQVTDGTFEVKIKGNGHQSCRIYGLEPGTYTVTEIVDAEAQSTTYSVDGASGAEFTVGAGNVSEVKIVNSYTQGGFTLDILKVLGGLNNDGTVQFTDQALPGAVFEIKDAGGNVVVQVTTSSGVGNAAALGHATIDLVPGTYTLQEITAPTGGYTILADPIQFKITDEGELALSGEAAGNAYAQVVGGTLTLKVANIGGFILPSTGGTGTLMYILSGGMLMMAAGVALVYKQSLRKEGREF